MLENKPTFHLSSREENQMTSLISNNYDEASEKTMCCMPVQHGANAQERKAWKTRVQKSDTFLCARRMRAETPV
ncbi:hypothetical protein SK128_004189 [Halocaridina rubra]|uniref:Uncharacterized protein n=1 Tax=Halocaridina rubra TaxID=373956 RepID=A0AAN8WT37_HALRR